MDPIQFTISFDTSIVGPSIAPTLLELLYEYISIGGLTDDINNLLNIAYGVYLIGTDSGVNSFTYTIARGWANPLILETLTAGRKH